MPHPPWLYSIDKLPQLQKAKFSLTTRKRLRPYIKQLTASQHGLAVHYFVQQQGNVGRHQRKTGLVSSAPTPSRCLNILSCTQCLLLLGRLSLLLRVRSSSGCCRLRFLDPGELESGEEEDSVVRCDICHGSIIPCSLNTSPPLSRGAVPSNALPYSYVLIS